MRLPCFLGMRSGKNEGIASVKGVTTGIQNQVTRSFLAFKIGGDGDRRFSAKHDHRTSLFPC